MMKILITGANGFIAQNLAAELRNQRDTELYACDRETAPDVLDEYATNCDFVFHLAGANRPQATEAFMADNCGFTEQLLARLKRQGNRAPVLVASSVQAELDNPYGRSKKAAEAVAFAYGRETGAPVFVYRLPNVFGKWCRPNYNSVVATFCHNLARGLPIQVNDPAVVLNLVYIDDVVAEFIRALAGRPNRAGAFCAVPTVHTANLGAIVALLQSFQASRAARTIPDLADAFTKALYSTYLSYLPPDAFSYPLQTQSDQRGSFTEFLKTPERGQVSVNVAKPGVVKGNHWHHTKAEKFLVVSGQGVIRFRRVGANDVFAYRVSGDKLEVVDIPPGYTHNIENTGATDLVTIMWANEPFDPDRPDTFFMEV